MNKHQAEKGHKSPAHKRGSHNNNNNNNNNNNINNNNNTSLDDDSDFLKELDDKQNKLQDVERERERQRWQEENTKLQQQCSLLSDEKVTDNKIER